ncbi:hypothetical protein C8R46DRAFT_886595, partial [Mycena filopes]
TWGGGSDSCLDYLLKYARLTNTDDTAYIDTCKTAAADSSITTLPRVSSISAPPFPRLIFCFHTEHQAQFKVMVLCDICWRSVCGLG